jgi:Protein of unknown function (DUF4242)
MSQIVVVERSFAEPPHAEALSERERLAADGLQQDRVIWLRTFASCDLRRMLCFYEAPDAESVGISQDRTGLPFERIWSGTSILPPRPPAFPDGYTTVIVEREIAHDVTEADWRQRAESGAWCLAAYRVELVESVFAPSHGRAVCVFIAPDTEAVRMANGQLGGQILHAWPCSGWRAA